MLAQSRELIRAHYQPLVRWEELDMHSREQYRRANNKQKTRLLNEARKRTRLARKVLIRKLAHPAKLEARFSSEAGCQRGVAVLTTLVRLGVVRLCLWAAARGSVADGSAACARQVN